MVNRQESTACLDARKVRAGGRTLGWLLSSAHRMLGGIGSGGVVVGQVILRYCRNLARSEFLNAFVHERDIPACGFQIGAQSFPEMS
jgi:hypothetical protein